VTNWKNRHTSVLSFVIEVKHNSFTIQVPPRSHVSDNFFHHKTGICKKKCGAWELNPTPVHSEASWLTIRTRLWSCSKLGTVFLIRFDYRIIHMTQTQSNPPRSKSNQAWGRRRCSSGRSLRRASMASLSDGQLRWTALAA
jgi:hypothetical protein